MSAGLDASCMLCRSSAGSFRICASSGFDSSSCEADPPYQNEMIRCTMTNRKFPTMFEKCMVAQVKLHHNFRHRAWLHVPDRDTAIVLSMADINSWDRTVPALLTVYVHSRTKVTANLLSTR